MVLILMVVKGTFCEDGLFSLHFLSRPGCQSHSMQSEKLHTVYKE